MRRAQTLFLAKRLPMSMMTAKVSRYQKLPILWPMRQAMTMKIEPQMASVGMT